MTDRISELADEAERAFESDWLRRKLRESDAVMRRLLKLVHCAEEDSDLVIAELRNRMVAR